MTAPSDNRKPDEPLISIVVPSFNHARFLPRTLDSILGQDYRRIEVIVVDGGSTDDTVALLRDYAARYPQLSWLSEADEGPADAVNKGLARVGGEIVGIQSSDDVYYPGAFARVAAVFVSNPDCGFVCGAVEGIDEDDNVLYRRSYDELTWESLFAVSMSIPQSSIFFRRHIAEQVGGWNGRYYGCDLDYWLRLLFRTRPMSVPHVLSAWRRYAGQRTRTDQFRRIWDDYWRMIEESPDVAAADPRLRRLAHASKHLLVLRTPPSRSYMVRWWHLLRGAWWHPGFWRHNPARLFLDLIPGSGGLRWLYRHVRRAVGGERPPRKAVLPNPEKLR